LKAWGSNVSARQHYKKCPLQTTSVALWIPHFAFIGRLLVFGAKAPELAKSVNF
jgi:hypothetical protein